MKSFLLFFASVLIFSAIYSCRREGLGGDNTLIVSTSYKSNPIKGATVFVRYGAKDFPGAGAGSYDLQTKAQNANDTVHIVGLRRGDYFIYGIGFDSASSNAVSGGMHINISSKSGNTVEKLSLSE